MRIPHPIQRIIAAFSLTLIAANPASAHEQTPAKPAMWKIADEDTTIYLFGTIHILPEDVHWFQGPVKKAFEKSDLLVTETETNSPAPNALQKAFLEKAVRTDGKSLRATLSDADRAKLEGALTQLGLSPAAMDNFEAWYAALLVSLLPLNTAGYDKANGVETQVDALAAQTNKARHPLESVEFQIDLFDGLPVETQNRYLLEVIDQLPTLQEDVAKVVTAWRTGKAEELARLLNEDEADEVMRTALITDRNKTWAQWLKARMDQPGTVFVAVGAGHLAGKGSVQDELSLAGIKAIRLQ